MPRPRELKITLKPLPLILCVAFGLWLGAVAIALSLWLALQLWPAQVLPVAQAVAPALAPAVTPAAQPMDAQGEMFERYQHILNKQQQQQAADAAQGNPRNLNSPRCQFWLQQNRTAPTDKSQANVLEFCY
ncbi:hypothetical protein HP546_08730 [Pseudomonas sp. CM25]|uniref:hypothetical protein n=1 Tax=Pseudomonas sp. CM25 TaxID=2738448 RepID=UPI0015523043|nr:hypothetical protein [Pseudomonas sp. CM25]NQD55429.1 hypothetical protein [Pseudomonas sp. CM25]HEN8802012.1 hypothetical protein [Pseudomonas putida]